MYKIILSASASLLFFATANADCPTLNLQTLPQATCGNNGAPFKTGPLSKMSYVSETPCPSGVGLRKKIQAIVKGAKDYPGRVIQEKAGEVSCTYKLDPTWQKVLKTTSPAIVLKAQITTPDQVNYLGFMRCPQLTADEFDIIENGGQFPFESTRKPGLTYIFQVMPLQKASATARFKEFFRMDDVRLTNLNAQITIVKPFEQFCEYSHNTGGSPVKSILHGVQDTGTAQSR